MLVGAALSTEAAAAFAGASNITLKLLQTVEEDDDATVFVSLSK